MNNYLIIVAFAAILYFIASKGMDLINEIRLKMGLSKIIRIVISDSETTVFDTSGHELFRDKNAIIYTTSRLLNKSIIWIGEIDKDNELQNEALHISNFTDELPKVLIDIHNFWYQYITWYVLKSKREMGLSPLIILAASIDVRVTSDQIKNSIKSELEKAIQTNRPKFYNIIDIN